jgi:hypothetical protein
MVKSASAQNVTRAGSSDRAQKTRRKLKPTSQNCVSGSDVKMLPNDDVADDTRRYERF